MEEMSEHRATQRRPVTMTVQCRTQSGMRDSGKISDISETGCCVVADGLFFKVGTRLVIRPEGLEGLVGTVRWVAGSKAGVEWENPIYGPVLDHLVSALRNQSIY